MLKLYSAPKTRSLRVAWLLEEIGKPYELVQAEFVPTQSEFFIQQTPTGKFPTIDDDGFVMMESGAIIEYLLDRYGNGQLMPPRGTTAFGEFLQWMYYADATAFSPLGIVIWLARYRQDADRHAYLVTDAIERAKTGFARLERHLADRQWLLGDRFTAADIMMGFTVLAGQGTNVVGADSPLASYVRRMQQREPFRVAYAKTNPEG